MSTEKNYAKIAGEQISKARKERGYTTQKMFAIAITGNPNASPTSISRLEAGRNNEYWRYIKVAQTLQVPLKFIFTKNEELPRKAYIDKMPFESRLDYELKRVGKFIRKKRKENSKVLLDFEKGIGVGLDSSNVSKLERGLANAKLDTIILALSEVDMTIEDVL